MLKGFKMSNKISQTLTGSIGCNTYTPELSLYLVCTCMKKLELS